MSAVPLPTSPITAPSAVGSSPFVLNITMAAFQQEVMQRSLEGLVVLDF